jgi:alpha-tubulin suppressor-like RCC1 family protein
VNGSLGRATFNPSPSPTPQPVCASSGCSSLLRSVLPQLAVGFSHACVVQYLPPGEYTCWGEDYDGELGDGANNQGTSYASIDYPLGALSTLQMALGTKFSCALVDDGTTHGFVKCWGYNGSGQLGTGNVASANTPQLVSW